MLTETLAKTLFEYNYWAHRLVWDQAITQLTDEQFTRPLDYSWGSVHNQVVHTMSAEWMWLSRLSGTSPSAMFDPDDYPARADVRAKWDTIEADMRRYVTALTSEGLQGTFTYSTTSGRTYTQNIAEILLHIINHGTDHRAQTLAMLHHLGAPTVEQDIIFYLRERDK